MPLFFSIATFAATTDLGSKAQSTTVLKTSTTINYKVLFNLTIMRKTMCSVKGGFLTIIHFKITTTHLDDATLQINVNIKNNY